MVIQRSRESQEVKKILIQFLKLHLNNFHLCRSSLQCCISRKTHNGLRLFCKVAFQSRASWSNEWPKIEQAKGPSPDHMLKWNNLQAMVSRAETMKNLTLWGGGKGSIMMVRNLNIIYGHQDLMPGILCHSLLNDWTGCSICSKSGCYLRSPQISPYKSYAARSKFMHLTTNNDYLSPFRLL